MNVLQMEKKISVISALAEGNSIRSVERMTGIHRDTIMRLGVKVGEGCAKIMDSEMKGLNCNYLQLDEIWGFIGKKQRNSSKAENKAGFGDAWTFVAIDAETKLVPVFRVGHRDSATANAFINDLHSRLENRVQISTDSMHAYVDAIEQSFGTDVDYAQLIKTYGAPNSTPGRYSPPKLLAVRKAKFVGHPEKAHISTSFVERQNLTMRMHVRRLTRLTNAFSKKLDNFKAAIALHFGYYNFALIHKTLRVTPAMAAGVSKKVWSVADLIERA